MAIATTNTQAPLGAVTVLKIVDGIRHFASAVVSCNEARVTRKILANLSPEQLRDVGLTSH